MPLDATDLELSQILTLLRARGWTVDTTTRTTTGIRISAHHPPITAPQHLGPLRDLDTAPRPPGI